MAKSTLVSLVSLSRTIEKGFASVAEDIGDIRKEMATKEDLETGLAAVRKEMATGFTNVRKEMGDGFALINRRLDTIIQIQLDQHAGRIKKLETAVFTR